MTGHCYKITIVRRSTFVRGEGCRLFDDAGREYLDCIAGIAVCSLGHAHPEIAAAIAEQARTLLHVSNLFYGGADGNARARTRGGAAGLGGRSFVIPALKRTKRRSSLRASVRFV